MTNYEKIKNMSVDDMAKILYKSDSMTNKICIEMAKRKIGVCRGAEDVDTCDCKKSVRKWLESEVTK